MPPDVVYPLIVLFVSHLVLAHHLFILLWQGLLEEGQGSLQSSWFACG